MVADISFEAPAARPHGSREGTAAPSGYVRCPRCAELQLREPLAANQSVCISCEHHFRLSARARLELLLDRHSFQEHDAAAQAVDPLGFAPPGRSYSEDLRYAQQRTGMLESLLCGSGSIDGQPLEIAVVDWEFMGGSMGTVFGEKLARTAERAIARRVPVLTITASGGARIQEGILSLMQMAKVALAFRRLGRAGQPHFALIVERCYGGVLTAYVAAADIVIAEPGAKIGFVGPRVVEQTMGRRAFVDAQSSEHLLERGLIDAVVPRCELQRFLAVLLDMYGRR